MRYGFLRVFVKLMQNYRKYMPNPSPSTAGNNHNGDEPSVSRLDSSIDDLHDNDDPPSSQSQSAASSQLPPGRKREWMNVDRFVSDTPASLRPFCSQFVQTQLFARFIDDRIAVDLELKAKEEARAESEAAFLRARGVLSMNGGGERREPPASAIKALGEMGLDKKTSRVILMRYPGAWSSHETAVDFVLQLQTWHKEREVREREEWESGGKKKSLIRPRHRPDSDEDARPDTVLRRVRAGQTQPPRVAVAQQAVHDAVLVRPQLAPVRAIHTGAAIVYGEWGGGVVHAAAGRGGRGGVPGHGEE